MKIRNIIWGATAAFALCAPLPVCAAGQDAVVLRQNGSGVEVVLEMSHATEEKITAVAVSLEIGTDRRDRIAVDFLFSPGVDAAESGFVYREDSGRLDIYVASAKSLFDGDILELGELKLSPVVQDQLVSVDVSYCPDSFQTANGSYGSKTPMVEGAVEAVRVQVGNGTPDLENTGANTGGEEKPGENAGGSQGEAPEEDHRNQGLYDETTRFANDPSDAQKIVSSVIRKENVPAALTDIGAKAAALQNMAGVGTADSLAPEAGKTGAPAGSTKEQGREKGKVSVVEPKNGPASILVSKEDGIRAPVGETADSPSDAAKESGTENGQEKAEITLDQKNGGTVKEPNEERRNRLIIITATLAGILILGGTGIIFAAANRKRAAANARRRRRRRRKNRQQSAKKRQR